MVTVDRLIGQRVKGYQIVERLGSGGMGSVYRAVHPLIGKEVAIKTLHREYSRKPEIVRRFFLEAKAANDIRHDNVIDILDFEENADGHFLLMEYLRGHSLNEALKNAPFSTERICHITTQICAGLEAAHQKGIIHRDLKSDNIFLIERAGQKDFVKILDFGIAKLLLDSSVKTQTGAIMGTPTYLSPEQINGEEVDARADIYSLGVLLYEMATGVPPFEHQNAVALLALHARTAPTPPEKKNPKVPPKLSQVILRCLAKNKTQRFSSMATLSLELDSLQEEDEPTALTEPAPMLLLQTDEQGTRKRLAPEHDTTGTFSNQHRVRRDEPTGQITIHEKDLMGSDDALTPIHERELVLDVSLEPPVTEKVTVKPRLNQSIDFRLQATVPADNDAMKSAVEKAKQILAAQAKANPPKALLPQPLPRIHESATIPEPKTQNKTAPEPPVPEQVTPLRASKQSVALWLWLLLLVIWSATLTFLLLYSSFSN